MRRGLRIDVRPAPDGSTGFFVQNLACRIPSELWEDSWVNLLSPRGTLYGFATLAEAREAVKAMEANANQPDTSVTGFLRRWTDVLAAGVSMACFYASGALDPNMAVAMASIPLLSVAFRKFLSLKQ